MTFNDNIPQPIDRFSQSQRDLLNNNASLNNVLAVDHIEPQPGVPAENDHKGKHRQCTIRTGGAPVTVADEGALHVVNTGGTRQQLYYARESATTQTPVSMMAAFGNFVRAGAVLNLTGTGYNFQTPVNITAPNLADFRFVRNMMDANYAVFVFTSGGAAGAVSDIAINGFKADVTAATRIFVVVYGEIS